jgi:hypothetical protein
MLTLIFPLHCIISFYTLKGKFIILSLYELLDSFQNTNEEKQEKSKFLRQ